MDNLAIVLNFQFLDMKKKFANIRDFDEFCQYLNFKRLYKNRLCLCILIIF